MSVFREDSKRKNFSAGIMSKLSFNDKITKHSDPPKGGTECFEEVQEFLKTIYKLTRIRSDPLPVPELPRRQPG